MSGLADTNYDEKSAGDVMRQKSIGGQHTEVLENKDLMNDAQNAEAREHEMGLWEAVKDHPMACFWAFIFCFTIVSVILEDEATANRLVKLRLSSMLTWTRLWNLLICS